MEERTQIGTSPMQLESDLRVDTLNNAAPTRYRRYEPDVRPAVSGHRSRSFLIAGSRALAEIDGGGNQSYYTGDFHGTVQASFTVSGQLEDSYGYDVFGSPLEASIETDRRGYVGKPFDPLTGLYNYGYRDYRPELGRFTTVDPIRDGMNWYVYTGNDPVNYVDLWGLATEDAPQTDVFESFMDFIREQGVERENPTDPFIQEKVADSWEEGIPEVVRDHEPGTFWGNIVDDQGNHQQNQRLPGGYHLTVDRNEEQVYVHHDVHDPTSGFAEFLSHLGEVNSESLDPEDRHPDWGE